MNCIGWSEHGSLFNWYLKKQLCDKYGLKYLHGIEIYITENLNEKRKDNWHTILVAKNYQGFVEINNLFFLSYQKDHFYYKPRITVDEFLAISDNVIKISACIQSPLWQYRKSILADEVRDINRIKKYIQMCKHYDYYEIQYHCFPDNLEYTKYLWDLSKRFGKSLIVGTDTHSLNKYKAECRTILQYGKTDNAWGDPENECDLTMKSYDELVEKFREQGILPEEEYLKAIDNTNVMADSCEVLTFDTHDKYPFLYGERDEEVMWEKIKRNYKEKRDAGIISNDIAYVEQIKEEMAVFKKVNMVGFMLFMAEMMTWAREQHIATGFSRGSVSGSVVAYITNITDVDPLKWHTIFSRFCNEHRVEAGD
jgi:DNA polymerase-3 subunit alpha